MAAAVVVIAGILPSQWQTGGTRRLIAPGQGPATRSGRVPSPYDLESRAAGQPGPGPQGVP